MKLTPLLVVFFLSFSGKISCENSTNDNIFDTLERLLTLVQSNERQIEDLKGLVTANVSKILDRADTLQSLGETALKNQKYMEDQINELKFNVSLVPKNTREIFESHSIVQLCKTPIKSGVYRYDDAGLTVYCEMDKYDGGWIVIQQRVENDVKFNRNWTDYRNGFGRVGENGTVWLGNEAIHRITSSGQYELIIEVKSPYRKIAIYSEFKLAGEDDKYRLTVGGFTGRGLKDQFGRSNNVQFSTYDSDNDNWQWNCARDYQSGWWYVDNCGYSDLNKTPVFFNDGPLNITYTRMLIRRK